MSNKSMLKELNHNKKIVLLGNGLLIFLVIQIASIFLQLYKRSHDLENPFIAKDLFFELSQKIVVGGLILSFGILLMFISKSLKQNLATLGLGVLVIIYFYLTMNGII